MLYLLIFLRQVRTADAKQDAENRKKFDAAVESGRQSNALELAEVKARAANFERQAQESAKQAQESAKQAQESAKKMAALERELQAARAQGPRSQISASVSFRTRTPLMLKHF